MTDVKTMREYLFERLTKIDSAEEADLFLQDLCTYAEIDNMAQRLYSAKLVTEGKTYNEVTEQTGISTATLSRVSACVKHGSGGYERIIKKS